MRLRRTFLLSILLLICANLAITVAQVAVSPAASRNAEAIRAFEEFTKEQMELDQIPGMSVGFLKDGSVWSSGYGFADLENKVPARPDSSYRLGSISKPMTAVAVLQLAEKGKVNLDAEVQTYVPYFPRKQWPVTVRQLLGHLGGISHYQNYNVEGRIKEHKNTREAIAIFENFDLVAEPGTKYSYSSYGYNLLGAVIEGASGQSYGEYLQENIWKPLQMNGTRMDSPTDIIPNRVRGYQILNGEIKNSEFVDMSSRFGAGGARSTVIDLLKLADALNHGKLLSKESLNAMWSSMETSDRQFTDYGMGWDVDSINGHFAVWHSGSQQETRTILYNFPAKHFAVAIEINQEDVSPARYARRLYQLLFDEPWNLAVYSTDPASRASIEAVTSVFQNGFAYFERYQKAMRGDSKQLAEAFHYFNDICNSKISGEPAALKKISAGRQPAAGEPLTRLGSYMASKIQEKIGSARMNEFGSTGAIPFFSEYVAIYKKDRTIPKELRFSKSFEQKLVRWSKDWSRTNTSFARTLWLDPDSNMKEIQRTLTSTIAGATIYPDLTGSFTSTTRQILRAKDWKKAADTAQIAMEFYPQSPDATAIYAVSLLHGGPDNQIKALLKQSAQRNPDGLAGAEGIGSFAYDLANWGNTDEAIRLLQLGKDLYPREADFYEGLGELYLQKGEKEKAANAFQKALSLNPDLQNAKDQLKKLTQ